MQMCGHIFAASLHLHDEAAGGCRRAHRRSLASTLASKRRCREYARVCARIQMSVKRAAQSIETVCFCAFCPLNVAQFLDVRFGETICALRCL